MPGHRKITLNSGGFRVLDQPPADKYSDVSAMFAHLAPLPIPRDGVILDIGANVGIYALSFARLYDRATVYALEPHPNTYDLLVANIELNPDLRERIRPVNVGLLNAEGQRSLSIPTADVHPRYDAAAHEINSGLFSVYGEGADRVAGRFVTLDTFAATLPRIVFAKIDVEGSEYDVLDGGHRTIDRDRPILQIEYNELTRTLSRHGPVDFEEFFKTRGYSLFGLEYGWNPELKPLATLRDIDNVSDLVCVPSDTV